MKLRMFSKQRGAHHEAVLIIGAVVALVGTLGFVGYNTWQGQSANADVCASKNTPQARQNCLQEKVSALKLQVSNLQTYLNKHPNLKQKDRKPIQTQIDNKNKLIANYTSRIAVLEKQINGTVKASTSASPVKDCAKKHTNSLAAEKNCLTEAKKFAEWQRDDNRGKNRAAMNKAETDLKAINSRIASIDKLISQQKDLKSTAPVNTGKSASGIGATACENYLGRIWKNNTCVEQCRAGAGSLAAASPHSYCTKAASKLSASLCNAKHRVYISSVGVCAKRWNGNTNACAAGYPSYIESEPYDYCENLYSNRNPANR